ncbi:hypothetical protein BH23PAT1_BH23PAT1_4130 [soil metagenome]
MEADEVTRIQQKYKFWRKLAIYSIPICATIYFCIVASQDNLSEQQTEQIINIVLAPGVLVAMVAFFVRWYYLGRYEHTAFDTFADLLKLHERYGIEKINDKSVIVSGAKTVVYEKARGDKYRSFNLVSAAYLPRSDYTRVTSRLYIYSVKLKHRYPHIFIDGLGQNMLTLKRIDGWTLRNKLSISERMQDLEADFPRRFKIFTAVTERFRVLSILTPDVMESIDRLGKYVDIEIVDNQLNVILDPSVLRERSLDELVSTTEFVVADLVKQLKLPIDDQSHYEYLKTNIYRLPIIDFLTIFIPVFFYPIIIMLIFLPSFLIGSVLGLIFRLLLHVIGY